MPDQAIPKQWITAPQVELPAEVLHAAGDDPLLAAILYRRGFSDPNAIRGYLDPDAYHPSSPYALPGMDRAVDRILLAIQQQEPVLIWGDFDADGQTSTTILVQALRACGALVDYHIPLREVEGHGMKSAYLRPYLDTGVKLVITCDTGISESDAVALAVEQGVDVIVTDHHELPEKLPVGAVALVNPRLLPANHPLATMPGCGVAYKLAEALLSRCGNPLDAAELLDLAALGIVADLAELHGDARYLLQRGLVELRRCRRPGLARLLQLIELDPLSLNEVHLAFYLAPRLNALGRLADANVAVDFFTTTDQARAAFLAAELDGLNTRRKLLTDQVLQGALAQIEQHPAWQDQAVLMVEHPEWPGGVLGIAASQLVNRYNKPAFVFQTSDGVTARGSARSVPGLNITEIIAAQRELLKTFGGHPMAAGLSMPADRLAEFRQRVHHAVLEQGLTARPEPQLIIDAVIPLSDLSLETAERLNRLSPFGQGNPPPVLVSPAVRIEYSTPMGKFKEHLSLRLQSPSEDQADAIWWQGAGQPLPEDWFQLAYTARVNTFRGNAQLQLEWLDSHPQESSQELPALRSTQLVDMRGIDDARLTEVLQAEDSTALLIFAEADQRAQWKGRDRTEISAAEGLVLLTLPADEELLKRLFKQVKPLRVWLVGRDPGSSTPEPFLRRLMGVMRFFGQSSANRVPLEKLAAACAARVSTVELGLKYLSARGELIMRPSEPGQAAFDWAQNRPSIQVNEAASRLERSLAETAAFRRSLLTLPVDDWRHTWLRKK